MSAVVQTVRGPVDADELGFTSMHEHVLADGTCYLDVPATLPAGLDPEAPVSLQSTGLVRRELRASRDNLVLDDADLACAELGEFADLGGCTVVEMSAVGLRADVGALAEISARTGVHIVAGTGLYIGDSWPPAYRDRSARALADWMVGEIESGIDGTGIRAGHIGEIGVTDLSEHERRSLEAAARAALSTGLALTIHPGFEDGVDGLAIADLLESLGMPPERVVLAHADAFFVEHDERRLVDDPDCWGLRLDYHRALLARGYTLAVDCFGHDWSVESAGQFGETDWQRLAGLVALLREGHAGQLVVACDVFMRTLLRRGGGTGYARLPGWVIPRLRHHGIPDADIEQLCVHNPRRLLSPVG